MALFSSKYANLEIVIKPARIYIDTNGNRRIDKGKSIQFKNGFYETDDKQEIEYLRDYAKRKQGIVIEVKGKDIKKDKEEKEEKE